MAKYMNSKSQMKRQSGEIRDVLFSAEMIEVAGEPSILSMAQDITERKQNEKKIQEQERFIRATFDSLPEQICVFDENYKIISTNLGWRRFASENDHPQDGFQRCELFIRLQSSQWSVYKVCQTICRWSGSRYARGNRRVSPRISM